MFFNISIYFLIKFCFQKTYNYVFSKQESLDLSLIKEVFHKQRFVLDERRFPQAKIFPQENFFP